MPDHKRTCFIFNPSANGGRAARQEKKLKYRISKYWPDAEWIVTRPDNKNWAKLAGKTDQFNLLVACGGDGTVHNTGNLAANAGSALGVIPLGSGNDFAKMNNIPESVDSAIDLLRINFIKEIDLIHCSGDISCWCLNTIGFGLDGLANYYTNYYKRYIGKSGYLPGALQAAMISKPKQIGLRIDGNEEKIKSLLMLTACNGFREGGRFLVAPDAVIDDGKMNLLKVLPMNKLALLMALPQFVNRFPKHLKQIESCTCKTLEISSKDPVTLHVDGEYSGKEVNIIRLEVIKKAVRLLV
ncbi:diacylglycerol kinase family lipid kinase [soil metagenome]